MTVLRLSEAPGNPEQVRAMYSAIGGYLAELGFNLDFVRHGCGCEFKSE